MTALVSPRPSASVAIAAAVKPGVCPHPAKRDPHVLQEMLERRHALLIPIVLLERLHESEREEGAASRLGWRRPRRRFASVSNARWSSISSRSRVRRAAASSTSSAESANASALSREILRLHGKEAIDQGGRLLPPPCLGLELLTARFGQPIEARDPVVLGRSPLRGNGTFLLQSQEERIERAMLSVSRSPLICSMRLARP